VSLKFATHLHYQLAAAAAVCCNRQVANAVPARQAYWHFSSLLATCSRSLLYYPLHADDRHWIVIDCHTKRNAEQNWKLTDSASNRLFLDVSHDLNFKVNQFILEQS